jgi:RNA polymerase sigma-70 factor (ECF subfamily)
LPAPTGVAPEASPDFGSFYRETLRPLRDYLSRFLGNRTEAQDIAHDAYLKTYQAMASRPVHQPRAYLYETARHLASNFRIRRGNRMQPTESSVLEFKAGLTPAPTDSIMAAQDQSLYRAAVQALPAGCQEVLVLRLHHGLTPPQIAQKLHLSESTVSNQLTRAMRLVRDHLAAQNAASKPRQKASGH